MNPISRFITKLTRATPAARRNKRADAAQRAARRPAVRRETTSVDAIGYLGDWRQPLPDAQWTPVDDGLPQPGEVAWAWVPYEEDASQGKDRPVVLVAEHPSQQRAFLALYLTSKDHDRDAAQEARAGRLWMDVGSGTWDRSGRPSEVRLNRVLQLRESEIRREGAALPEDLFTEIVEAANRSLRSR